MIDCFIVNAGLLFIIYDSLSSALRLENEPLPENCAVKVFKTTLTDFKTRERYIREDYRFKDRVSKNNSQKVGHCRSASRVYWGLSQSIWVAIFHVLHSLLLDKYWGKREIYY